MIDKKNEKIICLNFSNGKKHDFKLFKESKIHIKENTEIYGDSGYQGLQEIIANSSIPKKATKKNKLTKSEKKNNHEISKKRIFVENVIGRVKVFRILSEKYRNRRKRFALRFQLIAGIYNYERC